MLLEDAGLLAECRRLVFPIVDLADRDLQGILSLNFGYGERGCEQSKREARETGTFHLRFPPFVLAGFLATVFLAAVLPGRAAAFVVAAAPSVGRAGMPPRFVSRVCQYSQARLCAVGS